MKKLLILLCSGLFSLSACDGNKTPEQEDAEEKGGLPNISMFITSCESTDSLLCNPDSCVATDCGIEDYYFTLKGNVVQRVSCLGEEDALWVMGKYRVGDSGIVCQMDKVYMVSLKPGPDGTVNYNKGEYVNLENKEPHLLARSACKGILYTKRYSVTQLTELRQHRENVPFGRIYSEKKDREEAMVVELKKVKVLADL